MSTLNSVSWPLFVHMLAWVCKSCQPRPGMCFVYALIQRASADL